VARPLNSFDVFDTLIARRSVEPDGVLRKLEDRAGLPGLAAARLAADRNLGSRGQPYQLHDIWQEVGRVLGLESASIRRLQEQEIGLEHDEIIPIAENLALVQDGDLLVSDTYLPAEVVLSLLRHAGLNQRVALVVSNDGKFRGSLWAELLAKISIRQHFGDNPHSDGRTPSAAGIPAVIYTGAGRTAVERYLTEQGCEPLANLVREVRLANPFTRASAPQQHLWLLSCQLNFPLLFLASLALEQFAGASGIREVLFVSRDCLLWRELFAALFPHRRATYLYASRLCLLRPSENYLAYFRSVWHAGCVVVDLFSTGASWSSLFTRLNVKARCFFIGRVDNYAYLPEAPRPEDWLDVTALFCNSELGAPLNKGVEMLNYAAHASVEDVVPLPGGAALPVLAETLEYDPALPEAAQQAFQACIARLPYYPEILSRRPASLTDLIKTLVRMICADRHLDTLFPRHQAADADYLRRLLG
jgi:hypothetical protein